MRRGSGRRRPLLLLAPATFFEGYDTFLLALALPLIREDFGLTLGQAGVVVSVAFAGSFGVLALLPLADRFGRRPLLAVTIAGYTIATAATALSRGVVDLAIFQFVARVFLGTEYALASIVLVESAPAGERGKQLGVLASSSAIGMAAAGAGFLIVLATGASWRVLYAAGLLPLVLVARARRDLPETLSTRGAARFPLGSLRLPHVLGTSAVTLLFAVFTTAVTTFASLLVLEEWAWTVSDIRPQYLAVWLLGMSGFFVSGRLMDGWGRRPTTALFLVGAWAAGLFAFTASGDAQRALGLGAVIFFVTGATPGVTAYAAEPFPEAARGRVGALFRAMNISGAAAAPALTGILAAGLGSVGHALAWIGAAHLAAAGVLVATLPETRAAREPLPDPGRRPPQPGREGPG